MTAQIEVVRDYEGRGVVRILTGSKNYFMRFGFNDHKGWTPWRKTGTPDLGKASQIASDEYLRLRGRLSGAREKIDIAQIYDDFTFVGAAGRWLDMYLRKAEMNEPAGNGGRPASLTQHKTYKELVDRYMAAFFKRKNLDSFKDKDIYDYVQWRRSYFTTGPGSSIDTRETMRNGKVYHHKVKHEPVELRSGELATIKAIFEFASKEGLITAKQIPDIPKSSKNVKDIKKTRHPVFSKEHWKTIEDKIDAYTKTPNAKDHQARIGFKYFMLIMAETGLRSGKEHMAIKWRHIEFDRVKDTGDEIAYINVPEESKTGSRLIIVTPHGTKLIRELKAWTACSGEEDPIFANQKTGEPIKRYSGAFKKLMAFCGITKSKDDKVYAPYSLRHTYATRLREGGLADHIIARLMGHTDTDMIVKHYGQDELTVHAGKIAATDTHRVTKKPPKALEYEKGVLIDAILSLPAAEKTELAFEEDDGTKLVVKNGVISAERQTD